MGIVIGSDMFDELLRLKTKMDIRIMLMILNFNMLDEETITSNLRISVKTLQKSLTRLIERGLVKRMRHKTNNSVRLIVSKRYNSIEPCNECKYSNIDKGIYLCGLEKIKCLYDKYRIGHGICNLMKQEYEEINALENLRGNIGKGGQTKDDINEWSYKDFVLFYMEQFKIHFPDAIAQTEMLSIRLNMKKLMKLIREKVRESKWRYVVKHYISKRMNECVELKTLINPSMLLEPVSIRKFLDGKGCKIVDLKYCKFNNIFCSYMKDEKCELEKSNISCDKELVERMKERYN